MVPGHSTEVQIVLITYSLSPLVKATQWMRHSLSIYLLKINNRIKISGITFHVLVNAITSQHGLYSRVLEKVLILLSPCISYSIQAPEILPLSICPIIDFFASPLPSTLIHYGSPGLAHSYILTSELVHRLFPLPRIFSPPISYLSFIS